MASINKAVYQFTGIPTHGGTLTRSITPEQELRRTVMSCMLWEGEFYESGESISKRIASLVTKVHPSVVAKVAIEARESSHLRHVPLLLVREMARTKEGKGYVRDTLRRVIQRPDELTEFLSIYWKDGKVPLAASVKKGLADAFNKFSAYSLSKYNQDHPVKLRDVMFLTHANPGSRMRYDKQYRKKFGRVANLNEKEQLYASIADKTLGIADTWEFRLSASHGVNKRGVWEQALRDKVVGPFALIRNLRNMIQEGVDDRLIHDSLIEAKSEKILPFRFLAALRAAPQYAGELEKMMLQNLEDQPKLKGRTILLVDVSGSMDRKLSDKSDLNRRDAAAGLAIMVREVCESCRVFSFAYRTVEIPAYRGLGLADAIVRSQTGATYLYDAVALANLEQHDRLIVITDEQANGSRQGERADAPKAIPGPRATGYIVNVASYQSGIGYGPWTQIDGWSEKVVDFIREYEREDITQD